LNHSDPDASVTVEDPGPGVVTSRGPNSMPWSNQDLRLYHGTVDTHAGSVLSGVRLDHPNIRPSSDFGRGFYMTPSVHQARKWAVSQSRSRFPGTQPAMVYFVVSRDEISRLESLWSVLGTPSADDYWSLVKHFRGRPRGVNHCRGGASPWYDVVAGPVSRDWVNREIVPGADQVSFHTQRAVAILNAVQDRGRLA